MNTVTKGDFPNDILLQKRIMLNTGVKNKYEYNVAFIIYKILI